MVTGRYVLPKGTVPPWPQVVAMRDRTLLALAFVCASAIAETPGIALALRMSRGELARARRAPTTLSAERRLILAAIVGRCFGAETVARELRRRTLAAAHWPRRTGHNAPNAITLGAGSGTTVPFDAWSAARGMQP